MRATSQLFVSYSLAGVTTASTPTGFLLGVKAYIIVSWRVATHREKTRENRILHENSKREPHLIELHFVTKTVFLCIYILIFLLMVMQGSAPIFFLLNILYSGVINV